MGEGGIWWIIAILVMLALALSSLYLYRIRYLLNHEASIQVSVRGEDGAWHNVIAILGPESLDLYSTRSLSLAPKVRWVRNTMSFEVQRPRGGISVATVLMPGKPGSAGESRRVASSPEEMAALLSWMDSSRPSAEPTLG
ncbi:DUF2550 family protein [Trueperella bernardiae]|uniref:DUF2550 family protein n=1 Tax=Trueperella bernardiae TaxID=59561 RepID=UPI0020445C1C|nr:DUF2550 family protein [Trueperella bernardiae]MCM3906812.1 DUF2550 family protein [Trueperella bernardiae]